jgi:CMP-N,N'-diacetyllegionaminic acid synthase
MTISHDPRVLAVIPARGGSKGFPGKNVADLAGIPLIGHSIAAARMMPWVTRCVVSTDDPEIALVAERLGGDVPFRRPAELAADDTPMARVLTHALAIVEKDETPYDYLLLLDPTSPARDPEQVRAALSQLVSRPDWDGVVSVSPPDFHPLWVGVAPSANGTLHRYFDQGAGTSSRQQLDRFLRINGTFYLWRTDFVRSVGDSWFDEGRHGMVETPEVCAASIDYPEQLETLRAKVDSGVISLAWLADR